MNSIKFYQNNILKYDLINKYRIKNIYLIPKLKYIIITTQLKNLEIKNLLSFLLKIELLTKNTQKCKFKFFLNFSNGNYKYKIKIKKYFLEFFLLKYIWMYIPIYKKKLNKPKYNYSIKIKSNTFKELEKFLYLENINFIQINIIFNNLYLKNQSFFFNSLKI